MTANTEPNFTRRWPPSNTMLHVAAFDSHCSSLGPSTRAVLWLQGCCFRCPGCIAPEMLAFRGGSATSIKTLAEQLVGLEQIEGVTFSGGEPFMQARSLVALIDQIGTQRDFSFMSYTGFTLEEIHTRGESDQINLLSRLDLLVDGRYRREQHATLLWRGSRNQRVHFLSERHADLRDSVGQAMVSLDLTIDLDGSFHWAGISPEGFRRAIEKSMHVNGVIARVKGV
jgi:anaerobic ribonucleoside-triphosphate reductase activating protein